jgi:hypothetical protein
LEVKAHRKSCQEPSFLQGIGREEFHTKKLTLAS